MGHCRYGVWVIAGMVLGHCRYGVWVIVGVMCGSL